jgi:hypothetical protein
MTRRHSSGLLLDEEVQVLPVRIDHHVRSSSFWDAPCRTDEAENRRILRVDRSVQVAGEDGSQVEAKPVVHDLWPLALIALVTLLLATWFFRHDLE